MSSLAIEARGLRKRFGNNAVLDGIDVAVEPGRILGYIGPNGAGKSTTVKILTGLLGAFEGEVRVLGFDPRKEPMEIKRRIGYVPENAILYEQLTIAEYLLFIGRLHDLDDHLIRERADAFLFAFDLSARLNSRISTLSKGMRQKVLLTSALLHSPELLFVDEPLSGLDVQSTILIKEFLRGFAQRGRTVFYCSHVMDVVERICDHIVILDHGRIVAQGSFEELARAGRGSSLEAIFAALTSEGGQKERAQRLLDALS
jgi:ABC-2 type transport system ATP-binding protein